MKLKIIFNFCSNTHIYTIYLDCTHQLLQPLTASSVPYPISMPTSCFLLLFFIFVLNNPLNPTGAVHMHISGYPRGHEQTTRCPQREVIDNPHLATINFSSSSYRIGPHMPSHPYWNFNWFYLVQINMVLWVDTYKHHVMSRKKSQLSSIFNDFVFFCLFHKVPCTLNCWKQWPTHRWALRVTYIWHLNKL